MKTLAGAPLCLGLLVASEALAQATFGPAQLLRASNNINPWELYPDRPLVLRPGQMALFGGASLSLSDDRIFEPFSVPLGVSLGVLPNLELGVDLSLDFNRPGPVMSAGVRSPRVYGRYELFPGIAFDGSIFIPVGKTDDRLGFRAEVPVRYAVLPELILFGAVTWSAYLGGDVARFTHFLQLGGSSMLRLGERFWVTGEVGVTARQADFTAAALPVGVSLGFELTRGLAVLPGFRFPDVQIPEDRVLQILLVFMFDAFGPTPAPLPAPG